MIQEDLMSSEVVNLTPAKAREWLETYAYPYQRRLRDYQVASYTRDINAENFSMTNLTLAVVPNSTDTRIWLVDGQHRVHATAAASKPCRFIVNTFAYPDEATALAKYGQMDSGIIRSIQDRMAGENMPERLGLSLKQTRQLSSACALIERGFIQSGRFKFSPEMERTALVDWSDAAKEFYRSTYCSNEIRTLIDVSPVMAVAIITLRALPIKARPFWTGMAADDGLKVGDPRHTLLKFLRGNKVAAHGASMYSRRVAMAWNAWFNDRELTVLVVPEASRLQPIRIAGTEYK